MNLLVDRETQTMEVDFSVGETHIYYTLGKDVVTTSVVRTFDIRDGVTKFSLVNTNRLLNANEKDVEPGKDGKYPTQFPSGTANVTEIAGSPPFGGPQLRTDAHQMVTTSNGEFVLDYGYNIHYVNPKIATNTKGCIGIKDSLQVLKLAFLFFLNEKCGEKTKITVVDSKKPVKDQKK